MGKRRCRWRQNVKVARASDVAKLVAQPTPGDEVSKIFGKMFEEAYTRASHVFRGDISTPYAFSFFKKGVKNRLKEWRIYSRELMVKASLAYSALVSAGVVGLRPRAMFKSYGSVLIAAQPDLISLDGRELLEFKLYPIDTYARVQSSIFAYVWERPVKLVGLIEEGDRYRAEMEVIQPPQHLMEIGVTYALAEKAAHKELWCSRRRITISSCYSCPFKQKRPMREEGDWISIFMSILDSQDEEEEPEGDWQEEQA